MPGLNRAVKIVAGLLIGVGLVLLALQILLDKSLNLALPLVFLMLGAAFFILVSLFLPRYPWASLLYIPGCLLLAFGVIFLLNVVTNDWNAWAYAWLLLVGGTGGGLLLADRHQHWSPIVSLVGIGMAVSGITLFAVFGAITGGLFIQVMAPILLALGGAALYWLQPEKILPARLLARFSHRQAPTPNLPANPDQSELPEPLSSRELEVLRLIDQGLSNPEIAERLTVAPSTVKTHINNIYSKMGVQTRVQALNRARELGLLAP